MPGIATPPDCGNQDSVDASWSSESRIPMPKAAAVARPKEVNRAISAAASAGMICSGSVYGSSWVTDDARMPSEPARNAAMSELLSEIVPGDTPLSIAATSFSDAARVASPNLVHL